MATTADFKNGLFMNFNGKPVSIVWFQHVKPGKGPAFVKTKLRNLENGRILENTFTAGAKIEVINVERRPYQFLYKDSEGYNFMHEETYEQISLGENLVDNADLMKEGQHVEMMFVADEERCLTCELPTKVELEVTYTEPAVKGDTASTSALKEATLETGAIIMVPLFIQQGEHIIVNTETREYASRSGRTSLFSEYVWATSCSRGPAAQGHINLNMATAATTSRYAWSAPTAAS